MIRQRVNSRAVVEGSLVLIVIGVGVFVGARGTFVEWLLVPLPFILLGIIAWATGSGASDVKFSSRDVAQIRHSMRDTTGRYKEDL